MFKTADLGSAVGSILISITPPSLPLFATPWSITRRTTGGAVFSGKIVVIQSNVETSVPTNTRLYIHKNNIFTKLHNKSLTKTKQETEIINNRCIVHRKTATGKGLKEKATHGKPHRWLILRWAQQDLNLWPADYESAALTVWAMGPETTFEIHQPESQCPTGCFSIK